jgi:hypothetical protein
MQVQVPYCIKAKRLSAPAGCSTAIERTDVGWSQNVKGASLRSFAAGQMEYRGVEKSRTSGQYFEKMGELLLSMGPGLGYI